MLNKVMFVKTFSAEAGANGCSKDILLCFPEGETETKKD